MIPKQLSTIFKEIAAVSDKQRELEAIAARHDLTLLKYAILKIVEKEPRETTEVLNKIPWRSSPITHTLKVMESTGLIDWERPTDNNRVKMIAITQKGNDVVRKVEKELEMKAQELNENAA